MDLAEVVAREEIRDVIARYSHAGDRGRLDDLVACFAEDGVMELEGLAPLRGRDAIRRHLAGVVEDLAAATTRATLRHHVSSIRIERTAADEATARAYFAVYTEIGLDHWGRYDDRFARTDAGWAIARRRVRVDGAAADSRMTAARR
jgi:uncharacterized protein (TIGR02246 family)